MKRYKFSRKGTGSQCLRTRMEMSRETKIISSDIIIKTRIFAMYLMNMGERKTKSLVEGNKV